MVVNIFLFSHSRSRSKAPSSSSSLSLPSTRSICSPASDNCVRSPSLTTPWPPHGALLPSTELPSTDRSLPIHIVCGDSEQNDDRRRVLASSAALTCERPHRGLCEMKSSCESYFFCASLDRQRALWFVETSVQHILLLSQSSLLCRRFCVVETVFR